MNRILSTACRRRATDPEHSLGALFDLHGRLLSASAGFVLLLQEPSLAEELLAIPRAFALRVACGYPARPAGPLGRRQVCFRGSVYWLHARYVSDGSTPVAAAVEVTLEIEGASPPVSLASQTTPVKTRFAVPGRSTKTPTRTGLPGFSARSNRLRARVGARPLRVPRS